MLCILLSVFQFNLKTANQIFGSTLMAVLSYDDRLVLTSKQWWQYTILM